MSYRSRRRARAEALAQLDAAAALDDLRSRVDRLELLERRIDKLEARMPMTLVEQRRAYRGRNTP